MCRVNIDTEHECLHFGNAMILSEIIRMFESRVIQEYSEFFILNFVVL